MHIKTTNQYLKVKVLAYGFSLTCVQCRESDSLQFQQVYICSPLPCATEGVSADSVHHQLVCDASGLATHLHLPQLSTSHILPLTKKV